MTAMRWLRGGTPKLALAALALTACADREQAEPGAADGEPVRGGTAVVALPADMGPLNPLVAAERYAQEVNRYALFVPLVQYDSTVDYVPALAESWELLGDTGAVFHLRRDVRWHDGTPTTAADVVFTYERAKDPATAFPNSAYLAEWTGVEAIDSFTVRFRFNPHADPLAGLPFMPIAPRHLLDSIPSERMAQAAFNRAPVGNGPYRFVEYRANDRWVFAANDEFVEELGGRPHLDRVVFRIIPEPAAQVTELRTGTVDLALAPPAGEFARLDSLPNIRAIARPSRQFALLGWNTRREPFNDARVRRALSMALDRSEMIALRYGHGELGVGPVPPFHWAYPEDIAPLPFSPDSARALLASAGIEDRDGDGTLELPGGADFTVELHAPTNNAFNRDLAELIRGDLEAIGVDVQLQGVEFGTLIENAMTVRDFDAVQLAWENDFRLNLRDIFHSAEREGPFQFAGYANPQVDSLIEAAARAPNRAAATPIYEELQRVMREEQPWSFLYYYPDLFAANERLRSLHMDIRGALVSMPEWWVSGGAQARGDSAVRSPTPDSAPAR